MELEEANRIEDIQHPSVRECLLHLGFHNDRIVVQHGADLPAMAGIGSSSAFTVGLLHALHAYRGETVARPQLAQEAIYVEQKRIGENVGYQDQAAVAVGGLNRIEFYQDEGIGWKRLRLAKTTVQALEDRLLMIFTGRARVASDIAAAQIKITPQKEQELHQMKEMVYEAEKILSGGESRLWEFGKLLHESWMLKRGLTQEISNSVIDSMYAAAREEGALGGKILGAGGGGFLLLFAEPEHHERIKARLINYPAISFKFERNSGSAVIYRD